MPHLPRTPRGQVLLFPTAATLARRTHPEDFPLDEALGILARYLPWAMGLQPIFDALSN